MRKNSSPAFLPRNNANSTHNNKSYTSVLTVNANVFVLNVLSMVFSTITVGKHKNHDVKTIRKAQPIVKSEVEASLEKL